MLSQRESLVPQPQCTTRAITCHVAQGMGCPYKVLLDWLLEIPHFLILVDQNVD